MPHSSASSRHPWVEIISQVDTWCIAKTSRSRTPYGAPEAPVMAKITGNRFNAPSDSASESGADGRADGVGVRGARCAVASVAPMACAAPK